MMLGFGKRVARPRSLTALMGVEIRYVSPFGLMAPGIFAVMAPLWDSEMVGSNGFKNA